MTISKMVRMSGGIPVRNAVAFFVEVAQEGLLHTDGREEEVEENVL